jgi:ATP synthase protein I
MELTDNRVNDSFSQKVSVKERRILKAKHEKKESVWSGIGMFGMVGWSVAVPTLLGAALGIWLDKTYAKSFSWTLTFLLLGLVGGCLIAWNWISKEHKKMNNDKEE